MSITILLSLAIIAVDDFQSATPTAALICPLLGKSVTIDGIAWDFPKGVRGRILMPAGDEVYISNRWTKQPDGTLDFKAAEGKLVRVVGILSFETFVPRESPVPGIVLQQPDQWRWLAIRMEAWQLIDRAENAYPQLIEK
jgi:hypothetical protein